jgi:Asp-tRNA(Asn)/Glu-tRNA(Gln) amidotransferase A subunit family amidase
MMIKSQLNKLLISEARAALLSGQISPLELVDATLDRIEKTDSKLHAWVMIDAEGARQQAKAMRPEDLATGYLAGIPFGIKDIFDVRGYPTAAGFAPWAGKIAAQDSDAAAALRSQGAIIIGKPVTTQFAFADPQNTRNPWALDRTSGGSSSGSGASVAARQVFAALGTQTVGSNLRPAAFNGVVGFKPSFGVVSTRGLFPLAESMDHPGVLARSVGDTALVFDSLRREPFGAIAQYQKPQVPRIGLLGSWNALAQPAIKESINRSATALSSAGADVREISLGAELGFIKATQWTLLQFEAADVHRQQFAKQREHYAPKLTAMLDIALALPPSDREKANRSRANIDERFAAAFESVDCLLCPVSPEFAPLMTASSTGDFSFLSAASLLGLPAFSLPTGLSEQGLPLAIQLIFPRKSDASAFAMAAWCESVLGLMPEPPDWPV